jgi:cholesterol transport system auxiliary component
MITMRKFIRLFVCLFVSIALNACWPLVGLKQADESFFVISNDGSVPQQTLPTSSLSLLVRETKANAFINSRKIIFSDNPATRNYYQLARWVEPPPARFTLLLIQHLERANVFASVSRLDSSALGDLQLNTEITEFYHDTRQTPGNVVIRVDAELIDLKKRSTIKEKWFSKTVSVEEYSAAGAVTAFSTGVNEILDEMLVWVSESVKTLPQPTE